MFKFLIFAKKINFDMVKREFDVKIWKNRHNLFTTVHLPDIFTRENSDVDIRYIKDWYDGIWSDIPYRPNSHSTLRFFNFRIAFGLLWSIQDLLREIYWRMLRPLLQHVQEIVRRCALTIIMHAPLLVMEVYAKKTL